MLMGPNEIILLRAISLLDTEKTIHINTSRLAHIHSVYTYTCILVYILYVAEWRKQRPLKGEIKNAFNT